MKKREKKSPKSSNLTKIIIILVVIVVIGAFLLLQKSGSKGGNSVSCSPAPEGCEYKVDTRMIQGELLYPCGVLSCQGYKATCEQGKENTETIQEGRAKVVTGLPVQVGGINRISSGLTAILVFSNGGLWNVYENSLPYKTPGYFVINNQAYTIEPTAFTNDSVSLKVYCGRKR